MRPAHQGGARAPISVLLAGAPLATVGPDAAGAAERVLTMLDEALVEAGHRSLVIAPEGSICRGQLLATPLPRGRLDDAATQRAERRHRAAIARALRDLRVDVVHMHGADFHRYLPDLGPPVLVTLHAPAVTVPPPALRIERPATFLHGVSAAQSAACPDDAFLLPEIPSGVEIDRHRFRALKRGFALAIGRMRPEKGFHLAIDAAARAGVPLVLAGAIPGGARERYFREAVEPRLGPHARFLGPIGAARKRRLLSAARCVLVPNVVAAATSLVAMEALASGTPVIAFRRGALGEIVEHGVTGFLVSDVTEMARAIKAIDSIDPAMCRRAAEDRFSSARMARAYLSRYEAVILAARCAAALAQHAGELPRRRA